MSTRFLAHLCFGIGGTVAFSSIVLAGPQTPQKCFEDSEVILESGVVDAITADVDGDGRDDLLALQPPMLNILRNDGENFQPYQSIKVGDGITKIAAGHINNDASPDVAILRGDELVIYINSGSGYPAASTNVIPLAAGPVHLLFADLDDDGDDDVVTTHTAIGQVNGVLFHPSGQLQQEIPILKLPGAKKTISAKLNGDDFTDLVVIAKDLSRVVFNRGSVQFDVEQFRLSVSPTLNILDLVANQATAGGVEEVLILWEVGVFVDRRSLFTVLSVEPDEVIELDGVGSEISSRPSAMAIVDFDGDGDHDVWLGSSDAGAAMPLFYFQRDDRWLNKRTASGSFDGPSKLLIVDMNVSDCLLVQSADGLQLLRREFNSYMRGMNYAVIWNYSNYLRCKVADLNRDGAYDIVAGTPSGIAVVWGGIRAPVIFDYVAQGFVRKEQIIDFDGDGRLDIGVEDFRGDFKIYRQRPTGSFELIATINQYDVVAIGDINNDGLFDLLPQFECTVHLQKPDKTFKELPVACVADCDDRPMLADMNGDYFDDIVRYNSICLSNGDGTFGELKSFDVSDLVEPTLIDLGDLDRDGDLDIFLEVDTATTGPGLVVFRNDGSGNMTRWLSPAGFGPPMSDTTSIALADIDGDGVYDLIHGNEREGGLWYEHGLGGGQFEPAQEWGFGRTRGTWSVRVGDFDGDGALDICGIGNPFATESLQYMFKVFGTCPIDCPRDINRDQRVNVMDLFELLRDWGSCPNCFSDFDRDARVGIGDLEALFEEWGACD